MTRLGRDETIGTIGAAVAGADARRPSPAQPSGATSSSVARTNRPAAERDPGISIQGLYARLGKAVQSNVLAELLQAGEDQEEPEWPTSPRSRYHPLCRQKIRWTKLPRKASPPVTRRPGRLFKPVPRTGRRRRKT